MASLPDLQEVRDAERAQTAGAARTAVFVVFLVSGVFFGTWATRIPAIRDRLDLSDGQLGLALSGIAVGAILAMPLAGAMAARVGSRRATRVAAAAVSLFFAVVALAPSFPALVALTVLLGVGMGSLDVTMNAHGVAVERRYGRPILSSFHAGFSAGGLLGALLGGLVAAAGVDARVHLAVVAVAGGAVVLLWSRRFLPGGEDAGGPQEPFFVRPPRKLWALGALAFSGLLIEGASGDWSAVYLHDDLGASPGAAAAGFTGFSIAMVVGRTVGDRLVEAFGPVRLIRLGGLVAGTGFAIALLVAAPPAAVLGFTAIGAGVSCIVPLVFRAAGHADGVAPGIALGAVSSMGYLGLMAGPPLVGGLAELSSLPSALWLLVGLAGVVTALGGTARMPRETVVAEREKIAA